MSERHFPPGRASSSTTGVVKPFGPHQCLACSGSDQTFQTRSIGASYVRFITSSRSAVDPFGLLAALRADILFLLLLKLCQVDVEVIEALLPEMAVALDPVGDLSQRRGLDAGGPQL